METTIEAEDTSQNTEISKAVIDLSNAETSSKLEIKSALNIEDIIANYKSLDTSDLTVLGYVNGHIFVDDTEVETEYIDTIALINLETKNKKTFQLQDTYHYINSRKYDDESLTLIFPSNDNKIHRTKININGTEQTDVLDLPFHTMATTYEDGFIFTTREENDEGVIKSAIYILPDDETTPKKILENSDDIAKVVEDNTLESGYLFTRAYYLNGFIGYQKIVGIENDVVTDVKSFLYDVKSEVEYPITGLDKNLDFISGNLKHIIAFSNKNSSNLGNVYVKEDDNYIEHPIPDYAKLYSLDYVYSLSENKVLIQNFNYLDVIDLNELTVDRVFQNDENRNIVYQVINYGDGDIKAFIKYDNVDETSALYYKD